ncbi:MAG TPA: hypothetical protein VEK06_02250, partial [Myxococcota bacterium]|nr:hypothetical protein [Myxococcota bacterium]
MRGHKKIFLLPSRVFRLAAGLLKQPLACGLWTLLICFSESGCRGFTSSDPPIHLNPNMDTQDKGKSYRASSFFEDGTYMRPQVSGTVARGQLHTDEHFEDGLLNGEAARSFPKGIVIDEN